VFASLRQSAALEFHASLQLLAERAAFLTGASGVAVALNQDGRFVYCAGLGSAVAEVGATADVTRYPLNPATLAHRASDWTGEASADGSRVAVPVLRDEKVVGFFELVPGTVALEHADMEAVTRLSAMVGTVLDHRDAAEHTESLIEEVKLEPAVPAGPVLWHAPEAIAPEPAPAERSQSTAPADVHACTACGFPVSGVRTLCVDCDKHGDETKRDLTPPAEMFATENESWISAHGYTIASLLVSVLAAAIVYWLR